MQTNRLETILIQLLKSEKLNKTKKRIKTKITTKI